MSLLALDPGPVRSAWVAALAVGLAWQEKDAER